MDSCSRRAGQAGSASMRRLGLLIVMSLMTLTASAQVDRFVVTTVDDSGPGTLRQAILDANSTVGQNTIDFDIPGAGPRVIQPITPLPAVTDAVFIDGFSQPGSAPNTAAEGDNAEIRIILDGSALVDMPGNAETGLVVQTSGVLLTGLSIVNFADTGIRIEKPKPLDPPLVTDCNVFGNYIGLLPDGSTTGGNRDGITVSFGARGNTIGGPAPLQQNVISGNIVRAVIMASRGNRVQGNIIGLDAAGQAAVGSGGGVFMLLSGNSDGNDTLIGGDSPGAGNTLAGLGGAAILISGNPDAPATNLRILDNLIGLDAAGINPVPNSLGSAIALSHTVNARIDGNVVAASLTGIGLSEGAIATTITDNLIGPFPGAGNGTGISLSQGARDNRIGDPVSGRGNTIFHNNLAGVDIQGIDTVGNRLSSNRIGDNGGLGVDLGDFDAGPTPNDPDDTDTGGNALLNFPEITSARAQQGDWFVDLEYQGAANADLVFELFANTACDPSGFGEGERPIGTLAATTDGSGRASASGRFPAPPSGFDVLTANASDATGNTSEFSACARARAVEPALAVPVDAPALLLVLGLLCLGIGLCVLRAASAS